MNQDRKFKAESAVFVVLRLNSLRLQAQDPKEKMRLSKGIDKILEDVRDGRVIDENQNIVTLETWPKYFIKYCENVVERNL